MFSQLFTVKQRKCLWFIKLTLVQLHWSSSLCLFLWSHLLYTVQTYCTSAHTHTQGPQIWLIFSTGKDRGVEEGEPLLISQQGDKDQSLWCALTHTHTHTHTECYTTGCNHKGTNVCPDPLCKGTPRAGQWKPHSAGGTRVNSGPRLPLLLCQTLVGEWLTDSPEAAGKPWHKKPSKKRNNSQL